MEATHCPKCGFSLQSPSLECPRCGLIFAKYKKPPEGDAPASQNAMPNAPPPISADSASEVPSVEPHLFDVLFPVIPLIGVLLLWYMVLAAPLFVAQDRLVWITILVVLGSSILIGADTVRLRIGKSGGYGPTSWTLGALLLWVVFYPAYLFFRQKHGAKTFAVLGLVCTVVYAAFAIYIGYEIAGGKKELADTLHNIFNTSFFR